MRHRDVPFKGAEPNKVAETLGLIADYREFEIAERYGGLGGLPDGEWVRMPAGYAPGGQPGPSVAYVFPIPAGYACLCSTTGAPPADDWLPFAETIEFLGEEE